MRYFLFLVSSVLPGCTSIPVEPPFTPTPLVQEVAVTVIEADDTSAACRAAFPANLGGHRVMLACAGWSNYMKKCTIIIPRNAPPQVLGHELRHCFEGNFH